MVPLGQGGRAFRRGNSIFYSYEMAPQPLKEPALRWQHLLAQAFCQHICSGNQMHFPLFIALSHTRNSVAEHQDRLHNANTYFALHWSHSTDSGLLELRARTQPERKMHSRQSCTAAKPVPIAVDTIRTKKLYRNKPSVILTAASTAAPFESREHTYEILQITDEQKKHLTWSQKHRRGRCQTSPPAYVCQ